MDFNDLIRSLFRIPNHDGSDRSPYGSPHEGGDKDRSSDRSPYGTPHEGDDKDSDPFFDDFFGRGRGMRDFFSMQTGFQEIFRQFEEEIMKGFGNSDIFVQDFPSLEAPPEFNHKSPRDEMLKSEQERPGVNRHKDSSVLVPEGAPSWFKFIPAHPRLKLPSDEKKSDIDIDKEVRVNPRTFSEPKFSFRSIEVRTIRKPDGTTEQIRTESDGKGNKTTTVITSDGDQPSKMIKKPFKSDPPGMPDLRRHYSSSSEEKPKMDPLKDSIFSKLFGKW